MQGSQRDKQYTTAWLLLAAILLYFVSVWFGLVWFSSKISSHLLFFCHPQSVLRNLITREDIGKVLDRLCKTNIAMGQEYFVKVSVRPAVLYSGVTLF